MTLQRARFMPGDEPGKHRAEWSGNDGIRPTSISDHLEGARAALEAGDVKSARVYVSRALAQNQRAGHEVGLPTEAPEQKSLHEASYWLDQALTDIRLEARVSHPFYITHAREFIERAISARP